MAATTIPPGTPPQLDLSGDARRHRRERAIGVVFFAAAVLSVVVSAAIILSLFGKGWEFIANADWGEVLTATRGTPARTTSASAP